MNHLQTEKSPYLEQHIDNPVDWYPWADEAFGRALDDNKLIFLSIGYSTCHWCHVMAHECFEDDEVAALLNRDYISIKVDREERPDIDQVYMEVCQRMTGSGGWPLTIIMTPDARPFYAATYIPKHGQHGRPGLMNLLPWVTDKWSVEPDLLINAANDLVEELLTVNSHDTGGSASLALHVEAVQLLKRSYDSSFGGFGKAPKFPRPHDLTFLLRRYRSSQDDECLSMALQTLQTMCRSGLYDQLGFGFHRYSTDERWLVPHFEKMLYDQAGLVIAYLEAWQVTGDEDCAKTAREVLAYLSRDMTSKEGAFFSAEDADSEGVEGKFYLWTSHEITELLGAEANEFCEEYQVRPPGNYHDEMTGEMTGNNILHLSHKKSGQQVDPVSHARFESARSLLFEVREKRIRPHLDDKILTAWNGMTISAFAQAGRLFKDQGYVENAQRAADFMLTALRDGEGRLLRRYREGEAAITAFSEDYAFLARGLLDLYSALFDVTYLQRAVELARHLKTLFQDPDNGKLYDTAADGERLLIRPSSTFDGAMPSASSVALDVFARLFLLTGDTSWKASADLLLNSLTHEVSRYPAGYTQTLQSASWLLEPTREIVIVGTLGDPATDLLLSAASTANLQQTVVLFKPDNDCELLNGLAPYVKMMTTRNDCATAYVCQNFSCAEPLNNVELLRQQLHSLPN